MRGRNSWNGVYRGGMNMKCVQRYGQYEIPYKTYFLYFH